MTATALQHLDDQPTLETPPAVEEDKQRSVKEFFREAWSQALVAVNATEEEVQKILNRMTGWVEVGPEEARRLATELSERLRRERSELENSLESAVRRAVSVFRLPTRDELSGLQARLSSLEARMEVLIQRSASAAR